MASQLSHARWGEAIRATVALWLFVLMIFLPIIIQRHGKEPWTGVALDCSTILYSIALALGMFAIYRATITVPSPARVLVRAGTVIALAALNTTMDLIFQGWVADHVAAAWASLPTDFGRAYSSTFNYMLVFSVNMILFHLNYTRRAGIARERRLAAANSAAQGAQLAALRYQLNPHFLFNALNSVSALIVTKRNDDAEAMTEKLSRFLRRSLNADPAELIPLEEEFALTEDYLDIESVRFGDRLIVSVDCADAACRVLVPSFLVQPLVENAIKHGVSPSRQPVAIDIGAAISDGALRITVANDLAPPGSNAEDLADGDGEGLDNVRRRIEAVYGQRVALTAGVAGNRFVVTIAIPEAQLAN
ncbi:histidine kinase [Sphingosinicella sp. LHD-64]|uniref:sensor histidine kinase n=1 Tax=Sphingosinicella sp. LHD-64 TaxID=3072139 RepID=UPI00280D726A|nr:histidine kinase [Sphingosinicella sp. LHD-64]MDQ8755741.1 histidine kinase [Sphingosinicella sp. LHD-64]